MTGRAKWDAWDAAGNRYNATVDAENRYLEIARNLGWSKSVGNEQKPATDVDLEHLSDEDEVPANASSAGLGVSVSRMARPDETADKSLHGLVLASDVPELVSLLNGHPNLDLNAFDEFVSVMTWRDVSILIFSLMKGYAPIHLACDRGHLEVVRLLLSRGANKDIKVIQPAVPVLKVLRRQPQDLDGFTPLQLSQEAGHTEIAKLLEQHS